MTNINQPVIYCDMDGVLCDFHAGVQKLTDEPTDSMSVSQKWKIVRQCPDFWESLEWFEGGKEIWRAVDLHNGHILSSLPYSDPNSRPGKLIWLAKNIDLTDSNRIHLVSQRNAKQSYALQNGTPNVLIDDYIKNIKEWTAAGGVAIYHSSAEESLRQLDALGFAIS